MRLKKDVYDQVQLQWMQHYQPYDHSWNAQNELYDKWINYLTNAFKNIYVAQYVD